MNTYAIHVTKNCNMECRYCYEDDKTSGNYSWNEVKEFIDDIIKQDNEFVVEFLGGEPFLNFVIIKKAYDYLEKNANVILYKITTNGTIINDEIIEFIQSIDNILVGVSHDGTQNMNQLRVLKPDGMNNRKNAHDKVMKNLHKLKNNIAEDKFGIHIVAHPYNVAFLSTGIDYLYNEGFRNIEIGIIENTLPKTQEFQENLIKQMSIISDRINNNEYPGLEITNFQNEPKPANKNYLINDGKIIGESFNGDTKLDEKYDVNKSSSNKNTDIVYNLRKRIYDYHTEAI